MSRILRPTRLRIDLSQLANNFRHIKRIIGPECAVCAVVKADAYGHGAVEIANKLVAEGCDYFGVALVEEAVRLREAGIETPIVLLGALCNGAGLRQAIDYDLEISIHHQPLLEQIQALAAGDRRRIKAHLKINTGMGRLGFDPGEMSSFCEKAGESGIDLVGAYTTLSSSDNPASVKTSAQIEIFRQAVKALEEHGFPPKIRHAANSGAILNFPDSLFNMVRPGLMLYGTSPTPDNSSHHFKPLATFETKIAQLTLHPAGAEIGYSGSFTCRRDSKIAILPVGYADGFNRLLSNMGEVLVRGHRAPIVGRVSMDLTAVDVTDIADVTAGDPVVLLGSDGGEEITAWQIAHQTGSIPWEVMCWISARVPRVYVD